MANFRQQEVPYDLASQSLFIERQQVWSSWDNGGERPQEEVNVAREDIGASNVKGQDWMLVHTYECIGACFNVAQI